MLPWLVAEEDSQVVGFAGATPWKARTAYRFSVEITVYLVPERAGRGIGSALYSNLLAILQARGIHAVIGGIALPNESSVARHKSLAFGELPTSRRWGSNSIDGSTSGTGSVRCNPP